MAVTKVVMPKLSDAMESGKIIRWLKQEGDRVQGGDIIAEVETDKADVEMEAFGGGVLRKILVAPGGKAPVGALIAVIAERDEDISGVLGTAPAPVAAPAVPSAQPAPAATMSERPATTAPQPRSEDFTTRPVPTPSPPAGTPAQPRKETRTPVAVAPVTAKPAAAPIREIRREDAEAGGERVKASPLARKIAAQAGVDLRLVQGSGPGGRIVRRDVEEAVVAEPVAAAPAVAQAEQGRAARAPAAAVRPRAAELPEYEDVPLSSMRAAIAKVMPLSKGPVPHFYVTVEVAMDRAWRLREELNALPDRPKISITDLLVRAATIALLQHPGVNASFQGNAIRVFHRVHMGLAVALEEGLITPVLRDCQARSVFEIAAASRDLAERARARRLRGNEIGGATFSISNLGMFGVTEFSAIINPPEGAILAVGAVREVPVVEGDRVTSGRRMAMTLSADHRVMDGAGAARFLADLKRLLEQPLELVV